MTMYFPLQSEQAGLCTPRTRLRFRSSRRSYDCVPRCTSFDRNIRSRDFRFRPPGFIGSRRLPDSSECFQGIGKEKGARPQDGRSRIPSCGR